MRVLDENLGQMIFLRGPKRERALGINRVALNDRAEQRIVRWEMVALGDYTGAMFTK